ncbi:MAG TPA: hypothetical protein VFR31_15300, partial [Thermoanaerobaculia bacterium]|nr:hypothetical protein [Thermoanaerobaculia bacterium]
MTSRPLPLRLPVVLLLGALALAGGLALARLWLPEWQGTAVPDEARFVSRYRALADRAGIALEPGEPRVQLATGSSTENMPGEDRYLDRFGSELDLRTAGRGTRVRLAHEGTLANDPKLRELVLDLSPSGRPRGLQWATRGWGRFFSLETAPATAERIRLLMELLLSPGESIGELRPSMMAGNSGYLAEIRGSGIAEHVQAIAQGGGSVYMSRRAGSLAEGLQRVKQFRFMDVLWQLAPSVLRFFAVLGLFV